MKLRKKFELGVLLLYCKLFKKRRPLFVSWYLTHRCNMRCKYCDISTFSNKELSSRQIFKIIDEFASLGGKGINLTGGEPLLRDDIGKIVDYAKAKGIFVKLNSNGLLVKQKINDIKNVGILEFSFDGPRRIHDMQRGRGSYDKVMEALKIAREKGIKTVLSVTVTKRNMNAIDKIIDFIEKEKILTHFQPVAPILGPYSFKKLEIPKESYSEVLDSIINGKQRCRFIVNTTLGLEYLKKEQKEIMRCGAFSINFVIAPNGDLYPCNGLYNRIKPYNCIKLGLKEAFLKSKPVNCDSCLCTQTLDLDLLYEKILSLDFVAIRDMIKSGLK